LREPKARAPGREELREEPKARAPGRPSVTINGHWKRKGGETCNHWKKKYSVKCHC